MLLPLSWLKQYVTINEPIEAVAERFIGLGFECEVTSPDIIDLEITPNRGDVLSMIGLAREYAAATNQTVAFPETIELTFGDQLPELTIVAEPNAYHRLSAIIIKNIKLGPSPDWLKSAIEAMGSNSINNIVDLTNYVMFELGIPLHAFDLDALPAQQFHVRLSTAGEKYLSLKDEERDLPEDTIIVDSNGEIVDLLGIRGGKSSMINENTTNVLLWATSVPRPLIRRAAKLLNIRTEGSYRHERETDWAMVPTALARIAKLTLDLAGGETTQAIDLQATHQEIKQIQLNTNLVNEILKLSLSPEDIREKLTALGFTVNGDMVTVPSWRYFDINFPEDLVEEVARIYGYNNLPRTIISSTGTKQQTDYARIESLKDQLIAASFSETYTESFAGREETKISGWPLDQLATLANPVNRDFAFCRPAILPNLVKLLALNSWSDDAKVFEIGKVFPSVNEEVVNIGIAVYGKQRALLEQWVPGEAIQVITPDHPLAQHFKLRRAATVAEIAIDQLKLEATNSFINPQGRPAYQRISPFSPSVRDISMIVSTDTAIDTLLKDVKDTSPEQIILVELFDQFQSEKFGPNKQSLGIHVVYQDTNKTLETEQVEQLYQKAVTLLTEKYQANIR